jgi:hypothetical protein
MITAIVRKVQALLARAGRADVEVEVVFPVMPSAIATPQQQTSGAPQLALPNGGRRRAGPASGAGPCRRQAACAGSPPLLSARPLAPLLRRPGAGARPRRRRGLLAGGRLRQLPLHEDEHAGGAAGRVREGGHGGRGAAGGERAPRVPADIRRHLLAQTMLPAACCPGHWQRLTFRPPLLLPPPPPPQAYKPRAYSELVAGKTIAQAGCEPILHMRHFQTSKAFSDALVADITSRNRQ